MLPTPLTLPEIPLPLRSSSNMIKRHSEFGEETVVIKTSINVLNSIVSNDTSLRCRLNMIEQKAARKNLTPNNVELCKVMNIKAAVFLTLKFYFFTGSLGCICCLKHLYSVGLFSFLLCVYTLTAVTLDYYDSSAPPF